MIQYRLRVIQVIRKGNILELNRLIVNISIMIRPHHFRCIQQISHFSDNRAKLRNIVSKFNRSQNRTDNTQRQNHNGQKDRGRQGSMLIQNGTNGKNHQPNTGPDSIAHGHKQLRVLHPIDRITGIIIYCIRILLIRVSRLIKCFNNLNATYILDNGCVHFLNPFHQAGKAFTIPP